LNRNYSILIRMQISGSEYENINIAFSGELPVKGEVDLCSNLSVTQ